MITDDRLVIRPRATRAAKNCHTCRARKIGCDRNLPSCRNCQRSNRVCEGYGIRLSWEDSSKDGRRKSLNFAVANVDRSTDGYVYLKDGLPFLNTTIHDLQNKTVTLRDHCQCESVARSLPNGLLKDCSQGLLLSYYESMLSRMITTVDDAENGFRTAILPLALSSKDDASQSLLQATLSLSALHLGRPDEALKFKLAAIKLLSSSFNAQAAPDVTQLATCMMLCVNGVFDASDNSWNVHLRGARSLVTKTGITRTTSSQTSFLLDWFAYHDVLQDYSLRVDRDHSGAKTFSDSPDDHVIIGSLGCSREVLFCISRVNQLRHVQSAWQRRHLDEADKLREQLQKLEQFVDIKDGQGVGHVDTSRITLTADFYRTAALLYLEQVVPVSRVSENYVDQLVNDCFSILDQLELCTSPWPLFILASWCTSDQHRIRILATLEAMHVKRRIQNVEIIESIIKALWRRTDLNDTDKRYHNMDWRDLVNIDDCMPSFI